MPAPERPSEAALHEVLLALASAEEGETVFACGLCRLVERSVERSLRTFFAEFVNDPKTREEWRQARGFCASHTPLLASLGDALATAILYSDLARLTRERWEAGRRRPGAPLGWRRTRGAARPCPACAESESASTRYTAALAAGLEREEVWEALGRGSGLCVAHAEQVMAAARPALAAKLREKERERLAALQAELEEIIRKNDYRFRGETWGPERDAWLRALQKITRPQT